jgi:hypothetical protein
MSHRVTVHVYNVQFIIPKVQRGCEVQVIDKKFFFSKKRTWKPLAKEENLSLVIIATTLKNFKNIFCKNKSHFSY